MIKEEAEHRIFLLEETKKAINENNSLKLKILSNQTTHSICSTQETESISIAVLMYTLSKLIERKDSIKIENWNNFINKIDSTLALAIKAIKQSNEEQYVVYLSEARKTIESISKNLKYYIKEVVRKACINKASKVYEHGISMEQTAKLLGITQWELAEYTGQKMPEINLNKTLDIKKRAKLALEFLE